MICPKCNIKNAEGVKYCSQCEAALPERDEFNSGGGFKSSIPGTVSSIGTHMANEALECNSRSPMILSATVRFWRKVLSST